MTKDRDKGFYWVNFPDEGWQPAEYLGDEEWRLINSDFSWDESQLNTVGELCERQKQTIENSVLNLCGVTNCNFKTVIALYEDVNSQLAVSEQILPVHKGDKLTIDGRYYEVEYVDYDFDKAIFEVVVSDCN